MMEWPRSYQELKANVDHITRVFDGKKWHHVYDGRYCEKFDSFSFSLDGKKDGYYEVIIFQPDTIKAFVINPPFEDEDS